MKGVRGVLSLTLAFLLAGMVAWAQETQAKKEGSATPSERPAQIHVANTFLRAWGKGRWDEARAVAADSIPVKVGDKQYTLDIAGGKAEALLVFPFKGLSTVREGGKVKGVTVDEITLKMEGTEKRGKGTLTLEEKDGRFRVIGVTVE